MRSAAIPQLLNGIEKEIAASAVAFILTHNHVGPPRNDAPMDAVIARGSP